MFDDGVFVGREAGAFVEERTDLAVKLDLGPVALETFVFVEGAFQWVVQADQFEQMRPGEARGEGGMCLRDDSLSSIKSADEVIDKGAAKITQGFVFWRGMGFTRLCPALRRRT